MSLITLKKLGRIIDYKLEKLSKIWESPHILFCKLETPDDEAQPQIENFLVSINKIHDELNEFVDEQKASTNDVDRFINECEAILNDCIKPEYYTLETFLQKYGYTPLQQINCNETLVSESSILKDEDLESKTKDLSLLEEDKITVQDLNDYVGSDDDDQEPTYAADKENDDTNVNVKPTCIPTPVIKRMNTVRNNDFFLTPRSLPQEPIYSPFYHPKK